MEPDTTLIDRMKLGLLKTVELVTARRVTPEEPR